MTRILIGDWDSEFHIIIPSYFRVNPVIFRDNLSRNGFKVGDDYDYVDAELNYFPSDNKDQKITITVSYNRTIREYLGPNAVEIVVKGPVSFQPIADKILEDLIKELLVEEIKFVDPQLDFVVPEVAFGQVNELNGFYERRKKEREQFIEEWQKRLKTHSYGKMISYERRNEDRT